VSIWFFLGCEDDCRCVDYFFVARIVVVRLIISCLRGLVGLLCFVRWCKGWWCCVDALFGERIVVVPLTK
jgi:hypothetical protein